MSGVHQFITSVQQFVSASRFLRLCFATAMLSLLTVTTWAQKTDSMIEMYMHSKGVVIPPIHPINVKSLPYLPADIQVLMANDVTLKHMLRMIRSAENEIVMSYFTIWPCSVASRILFEEIFARKEFLRQQNKELSVKIIFDPINYSNLLGLWLSQFHLGDSIRYFTDQGFEVRLYNPRQHVNRSHAKLFMVDKNEAISGSRNIGSLKIFVG